MSELEVFISKLGSVDGFSTSSIVVGKVSSLAHEARNDAMEAASLEAKSFLSSAQSAEVFFNLGN